MKYGGILSKVKTEKTYAICSFCKLVYQDDMIIGYYYGVRCPKCKVGVTRGLTKEEALELLDESHKELLR